MKIPQATRGGWIEVKERGCFDASFPTSKTRRGRVQEGGDVAPTLTSGGSENIWILDKIMNNEREIFVRLQIAREELKDKAREAWDKGEDIYRIFILGLYTMPMWWDDRCALINGYYSRLHRPEGKGWCFDWEKQKWFRIRKLTPRECFRLMDVSEPDIDKLMASGISNSQLYKCAGNSIVVSCLYHIFKNLFCSDKVVREYKEGEQIELF